MAELRARQGQPRSAEGQDVVRICHPTRECPAEAAACQDFTFRDRPLARIGAGARTIDAGSYRSGPSRGPVVQRQSGRGRAALAGSARLERLGLRSLRHGLRSLREGRALRRTAGARPLRCPGRAAPCLETGADAPNRGGGDRTARPCRAFDPAVSHVVASAAGDAEGVVRPRPDLRRSLCQPETLRKRPLSRQARHAVGDGRHVSRRLMASTAEAAISISCSGR